MSHVRTNLVIPNNQRTFTAEEAETLTQQEFDALSIADQTSLFNDHRAVYDRLTGNETTPQAEESPDDSFRRRFTETVDKAISRAFGHTSE